MKCKHYFGFDSQLNVKGILNQNEWDNLRKNEVNSPFAFEKTREEYEDNCEKAESYKEAARIICKELERNNAEKIVSCGVGKGILEWHIKRLCPSLNVGCTDYTQEAIKKVGNISSQLQCFYF